MPPRKRNSTAPGTPESSGRRRSTRISSSGQKSRYFEDDSDAAEEDELGSDGAGGGGGGRRQGGTVKRGRGRPPKKRAKVEEEEESDDYKEETEDDDAEEDGQDGGENGYGDEDEDVDEDEDGEDEVVVKKQGRVTIIPLPKMRDTGGVEYRDDRLHRNTLLFLKDLKAHNQRSWLKSHDNEYRRSLKDFQTFVESLTEKVVEADETIPELPLKDVIFRIYRDIRFSNDPTPYKPHYGAAWSRTGRKGPYACYYVHVEPGGGCFVGGGLWHPDGAHLQKLRASIDERPRRWRRVLAGDERFRRTFLPGAKEGDERGILRAFARANKENALKTKPKGFIAEHRDIELLKLRNFTVGKKIADGVLMADDAQEQVTEIVRAMVPFVTFLNSVVMPDLDLDDDESSSDEDEDEERASGDE